MHSCLKYIIFGISGTNEVCENVSGYHRQRGHYNTYYKKNPYIYLFVTRPCYPAQGLHYVPHTVCTGLNYGIDI
jgi:hypothetical protein